ncbi:MAG: siroheme synthase CysG [Hyphomicrobiaceae bacterium]|nr:siroheme synthase CysG [Hyphomicrobiaceae bacterium]
MRYFPLFADLEDAGVLVVGGGEQAAQKVRLLARTRARITLAAAEPADELAELERSGRITIAGQFTPELLDGPRLVYVATGDLAADRAVAEAAQARGIPVNVVDRPELSTFITPAIVDRAPVTVAIGTEGAAPIIAREIKTRLESWLPANLGRLAQRAQGLRSEVAQRVPDARQRRRLWERLLAGPFRWAVLAGREQEADAVLARELSGAGEASRGKGRVALIGAGPGDPDLLTLKALQRLQEADVLVVDRLVNPRILDYARRDAERIYVGKTPRGSATSQAEINRILVREAAAGKIVARLKGGDPFIFGRASEELAALDAAGIASEVVPGVTAAHACAARIHLPVTQRERVRQFSVVTGATAEGEPDLDWAALARQGTAFAVYMGVNNAPLVRANLIAAGADPATRVVIVENGTLPEERAVATTLADITDCIAACAIKGPAVIFVGLDWAGAGLAQPAAVESFARPQPRPRRPQSQINTRLEVEL